MANVLNNINIPIRDAYSRRTLIYKFWILLYVQQELIGEAENLQPAVEEVKALAGPVLSYLAAFTEAPARALQERIDKLQKTAEA